MGVGQVLLRITGKVVTGALNEEVIKASSRAQMCEGLTTNEQTNSLKRTNEQSEEKSTVTQYSNYMFIDDNICHKLLSDNGYTFRYQLV